MIPNNIITLSAGNLLWTQYLYRRFCRGFKRSKRKNLWCKYRGYGLTIFRKKGSRFDSPTKQYWWCKSKDDCPGRSFSKMSFDNEQEAIEDLWESLPPWLDVYKGAV